MSDYIKREDAINAFYTATGDGDKAEWCVGVIQSMPAADVVGGENGFWVPANLNPKSWAFICSVCGKTVYNVQPTRGKPQPKRCRYKFCPYCGHPMEES